ncbi:MAG: GIY-YIG nuclease family protein [Chthoniobacterales bacterium]|jgi:putative endonuclease|nr:GIY-YIG nuclease family protein [Chthoniobacterales bacterium]
MGGPAWIYILRGASGRHYIGLTQDLERRINEHRGGSCHSTRRLGGEITLVAERRCASLEEARALERRLKRMKNPAAAIAFVLGRSSPRL